MKMWATERGKAPAVDGTMDSSSTIGSLEAERPAVGSYFPGCPKCLIPTRLLIVPL